MKPKTKIRNTQEGFTKVPNWIFEVSNLSNAEFRVLLFILRYTRGFHRKAYKFTWVWISDETGVDKKYIGKAIMPKLRELGIVEYESKTGGGCLVKINIQLPLWFRAQKEVDSVNYSKNKEVDSVNFKGVTNTPKIEKKNTQSTNPPLAKDIYKEKLKNNNEYLRFKEFVESKEFTYETFKRYWLDNDDSDEALNIILKDKYDEYPTYDKFNSITASATTDDLLIKVVLSVSEYIKFYKLPENIDERKYIKKSHKYLDKHYWYQWWCKAERRIREDKHTLDRENYNTSIEEQLKVEEDSKVSEEEFNRQLADQRRINATKR